MEGISIESLINDLALILMLGAAATIIFKALKQPVVLGYIVAGFIASPHFSLFPSVGSEANIEFWAQIGIIVLLFSLGLEFSFKKLVAVGGSAIVTALIIVVGMMGLGFVVGKMLGFKAIDSIFLGGMISMSSTTIIIKALTDLNMRQRRFVPMIFAVLIVEDLFAVLMMVILSSVATGKNVASGEMLNSILRLSFFLLIWFTVGIFMLPTIFKRIRRIVSDEMLLVISMGLCFLMAVFSVKSGFSLALGAFVMGSILAGTVEAERIERLVTPVKDLFGAVFFISVGMMVNPQVIMANAGTIALLSVVVIVGMILFGTFGMLATGQPLKMAIQSGFTLTQIGEFSFIIASLGMTLGVLQDNIYPIIVAVSVITTFTTPFFIKQADPCYALLERVLPSTWTRLLNGYSAQAAQSEAPESHRLWSSIVRRYALRMLLYSVVAFAITYASCNYAQPLLTKWLNEWGGDLIGVVATVAILSPFLYAITRPSIKQRERDLLASEMGRVSVVPIVVMVLLGLVVSTAFVSSVLYRYEVMSSQMSLLVGFVLVLMIALLFAPFYKKRVALLEKRFIGNVNVRENRRTGRGNNLVSDLHLAYMRVGHDCPFVGERLKNANIRQRHGVNLVNIQRGGRLYPVPTGEMRIFPGDVLGVIGTDEQIQAMLPLVEAGQQPQPASPADTRLTHFTLGEHSTLVGKQLRHARLREDYESLLVTVQRGDDDYETPTPDFEFQAGDILWIVGDPKRLAELR